MVSLPAIPGAAAIAGRFIPAPRAPIAIIVASPPDAEMRPMSRTAGAAARLLARGAPHGSLVVRGSRVRAGCLAVAAA